MEKTKAFLEAHYKRYIFTICLLWFLMFFLPWDWHIGGVSIYYFVMKKLFVVFGVLSILYSVLIKKISLLIFGIICGIAPFFIRSLFWGALSAIVGFSSLWSIGEIFDQRKRVIKGWFPMNPKRKHEYPEDSLPYGGKL